MIYMPTTQQRFLFAALNTSFQWFVQAICLIPNQRVADRFVQWTKIESGRHCFVAIDEHETT